MTETIPRIRKSFFGCNSAHGFHCFFDFFHDLTDAKISIIKGGPGTGKSTFLQKIADEMLTRGFDIELQHCSLDPNSLDALIVPEIKTVVTAATGHHVFDPKHPGAVDEIINLGRYWDEAGIRRHTEDICTLTRESDRCFAKAYRILAAALLIKKNLRDLSTEFQDFSRVNALYESLCDDLFGAAPPAKCIGPERHLFMDSITPEKQASFMETVITETTRFFVVQGAPGTGKSSLLLRLATQARSRGLKVEYCHDPLDHHRVLHLIIPSLHAVISTAPLPHHPGEREYNLDHFLRGGIATRSGEIAQDEARVDAMMGAAMEALSMAKQNHGQLEGYYIPHMHFDEVERCRIDVLDQVLYHAETYHGFTRQEPVLA